MYEYVQFNVRVMYLKSLVMNYASNCFGQGSKPNAAQCTVIRARYIHTRFVLFGYFSCQFQEQLILGTRIYTHEIERYHENKTCIQIK